MTLSRVTATGRGRINARLKIEGYKYQFVSSAAMEASGKADIRLRGLDLSDMKIGASADIMRAKLRGESLTVRILDLDRIAGSRHGRVTRSLWSSPAARCFLTSSITDTEATTIPVSDTTGFASAGYVHIGTEAIEYSSKTSTSFDTLSRGQLSTIAQAHFVSNGEGLSDAAATDLPIGIEGRRAYLYLYGDGDSLTGDGALRWKGVVSTDVTWADGACTFQIDPITRLLEQPIGGDLAGTIGVRGIHYTSASPIEFVIQDYASGTVTTASARVVGFYESQAAFCDAATTAIGAALLGAGISLGTGSSLTVEPNTFDGWTLTYITPSASPRTIHVDVRSDLDVVLGEDSAGAPSSGWYQYALLVARTGDTAWTPAVSTRYTCVYYAPVPRGTLGHRFAWAGGSAGMESPSSTATYYRVYMSGLVQPTADDAILIASEDEARPMRVTSVDSATRSFYVDPAGIPSGFVRLSKTTEIKLGRNIASGDLTDLIVQLSLDSPDVANAGAMPLVTAADVVYDDDGGTDFADAIAAQPLAQGRGFFAFDDESTLGDIIEPELLALGAYQRFTLTGSVEWIRLRPVVPTDTAVWTIDDTAGAHPAIEKSPRGVLGMVLYRMGYDPRTGEWDKRTISYRDVQSTSATRTPITLEIAQRSTSSRTYRPGDDWTTLDRSALARVAMGAFALFGSPVATVTLDVDARYMDARIGDTVSISSSLLPDIEDGYSAIVSRTGMVVAHTLELATGRVQLGVLMHTQRFAGYSPGFLIASETLVSGTTWDITITLSPYTDSTAIADWLAAGDLVMVQRPDTSGSVNGTVDSIQSATVVRVTLTGAWTPSTDEWGLRSRVATSQPSAGSLARFAFNAAATRRITWSDGSDDAQVFS